MIRTFESPAEYVQGRHAIDQLGERLASLANSALLIGDADVLGIVGHDAEASLEEHGVETTIEEFGRESSEVEIDRITEISEDSSAEAIIGAGGGKALDTAKAVRENAGGAMISMPTIASTDAPTSSLSVIYSEDGEFERYWFYDEHPDLVLVDTAVIAGAPARFFRSGIADAMATWFEADAVEQAGGANFFGEGPTRAAHRL